MGQPREQDHHQQEADAPGQVPEEERLLEEAYLLILLAAFASTRYRLPLDPVLAIFASLPLLLVLELRSPGEPDTPGDGA
jgi:hypothetical protein